VKILIEIEKTCFIKPNIPFADEYREENPAPMFRKKFMAKPFHSAKLFVCGLGYGYYWLNGKKVSKDLFTAPVSDYNKTLWYNVYDVSDLLREGENIVAVICGNGFFNETFKSSWSHNTAAWRDNPKFVLKLEVDGETSLVSDSSWKCCVQSPVLFNQLRSGEYFDSRLYDEKWNAMDFNDSNWDYAIEDKTPPAGIFRECLCEPIRECDEYKTKEISNTGDRRYIFDIGQNISGYIRLRIKQNSGDVITIRYAEQIKDDKTLQLNNMGAHYPECPFQTDRFICNGEEFVWSPMFVYHGFRYIELTGIDNPRPETVTGIFVHQDLKLTSGFECSDVFLNSLFRIGRMATLSNLFYMPTDCPTREKLGWANDAQASAEQMLTNFNISALFKKWMVDINDAMREDGSMPGIIPTPGWGFEWGNGPVSDGIMFEIPYKIYLFTGDKSLLCDNLPYFKRYFKYLLSKADREDGLVEFGLNDWAAPCENSLTPAKFINAVFYIKFLKIALLSANLSGNKEEAVEFESEIVRMSRLFKEKYMNPDGTCAVDEQTAVSMVLFHKLYDMLEPLKAQLKRLVEEKDFHHNCGMVGLRHLYTALNKCGLQEYAYKIITAKGYPSYSVWLDGDATTLWETWQPGNSKNHHMYSDFMSWMVKTLVGINATFEAPGFEKVIISPAFLSEISYCKGYCDTVRGRILVSWKRENGSITLEIDIPEGVVGEFDGKSLKTGKHKIIIKST
jgi:alpha-L-rhamnosidase